jgi:hypothetical protein
MHRGSQGTSYATKQAMHAGAIDDGTFSSIEYLSVVSDFCPRSVGKIFNQRHRAMRRVR